MTPIEVKTICELLANRVVPQSAREGAAIMQLATKLAAHFAQEMKPSPAASADQPGSTG